MRKSKSLNIPKEKEDSCKKIKSKSLTKVSNIKPKTKIKSNSFDEFIKKLLKFNLLESCARQKLDDDDAPFRLNIPIGIIEILCLKTFDLFSKESNLLELESPFYIFGDIHGQYSDLLRFLEMIELPPKTKLLFLGDYVDRGENSLEVICLLFSLKIKFPNHVYLLRGNHECSDLNNAYGFKDECIERYNYKDGNHIWREINKSFNMLPICSILNKKIFCVHGGISPHIENIKQINEINRNCCIPDKGILCDFTWSDPKKQKSKWNDNDRGCSYTFNEKASDDFMKKLNIELVIRAHQVVDNGFQFFNDKKVVTIFSAPNYCGDLGNTASIMKINEKLECSFLSLKPISKNKKKYRSKSASKQ